ncbi:MAG: response regulator transcription factor [Bacteroidetes bacterium]|nr:response regulator transcription factor [Bacteroidota bacterium]MBS1929825.1 response regulator transcription factor [Bacteroidota bacterium]
MPSNSIKAILIDDEKTSLQNLKQKLEEFCKQVVVVGATQNPEEAITLIRNLKPDVLFLDIEMPKMSGFRMLEELGDYDAEIIFTTAYNHYAIDAMRISAFDYLVKPVAIEELENAVKRLAEKKATYTQERFHVLKESITENKNQENKIAVPVRDGFEFVVIKNILRIESSSSYSRIFFRDGKSIIVTKLLKDFEEILTPYHFFRVHNSHLINLNYIKKYLRGIGGQVLMDNGDLIDVSRRKKDEFISILNI